MKKTTKTLIAIAAFLGFAANLSAKDVTIYVKTAAAPSIESWYGSSDKATMKPTLVKNASTGHDEEFYYYTFKNVTHEKGVGFNLHTTSDNWTDTPVDGYKDDAYFVWDLKTKNIADVTNIVANGSLNKNNMPALYITGNFNSWAANANPMTVEDDLSYTYTLDATAIEDDVDINFVRGASDWFQLSYQTWVCPGYWWKHKDSWGTNTLDNSRTNFKTYKVTLKNIDPSLSWGWTVDFEGLESRGVADAEVTMCFFSGGYNSWGKDPFTKNDDGTYTVDIDASSFSQNTSMYNLVVNDADNKEAWLTYNNMVIDDQENLISGQYFNNLIYKTFRLTATWNGGANPNVGWTLKVEGLDKREATEVVIGETGYATMYYGNLGYNLLVPTGVEAITYNEVSDQTLVQGKTYQAGEVLPEATAVILKGNAGTYQFERCAKTGWASISNLLRGTDTASETTGGDRYYKLSLDEQDTPGTIGFYWGAANGAAFTNTAHKAYLALPAVAAYAKMLRLNDETTGITCHENAYVGADCFNIAGQRVAPTAKGIVIMNGKKFINK